MVFEHSVTNVKTQPLVYGLLDQLAEVFVLDDAAFNGVEGHSCELAAVPLHDVNAGILAFFQTDLNMEGSSGLTPPASPSLLPL